jgi:hypothetical protein
MERKGKADEREGRIREKRKNANGRRKSREISGKRTRKTYKKGRDKRNVKIEDR